LVIQPKPARFAKISELIEELALFARPVKRFNAGYGKNCGLQKIAEDAN